MNRDLLFFSKTYNFLNDYIPKQQNGTECTLSTYKQGLKSFRTYVTVDKDISINQFQFSQCTYDFILEYRNTLHDEKHLSESTVNNKLSVIRSYMNYVAARDITLQPFAFAVSQVPLYTVPRIQQPIIESKDSLKALLAEPANTKRGLRDKVIMSVLYDGGLRLNELLSIKIGDISLIDNLYKILLHGKGKKERYCILDEKASALVRQYLLIYHPQMVSTDPFIYTVIGGNKKTMSRRNVEKLLKNYADDIRQKYDLPDKVSPHTLRRTRGTYLYRAGVPIEEIAIQFGHEDPKTTRTHYASPSVEQIRQITQKANEAIPEEEQLWPDDEEELKKILGF